MTDEKNILVSTFNKQEVIEMFEELPYKLPDQVYYHFRDAPISELKLVALSYSGNKKNPTFQEWVESYQHNKLLERSIAFGDRGDKIKKSIYEAEEILKKAEEENAPSELLKPLKREVKRLNNLYESNETYWMKIQEVLNKMITTKLSREAPKQIDVTHRKITPGDVASLLHDARQEIIDAEFNEGD